MTDIVCTIGPASWDRENLKNMIINGMTIARMNGAFIDTIQMQKVDDLIKELCEETGKIYGKDIKMLLDIKGTEVRLNDFAGTIRLIPGEEFILGNSTDFVYPKTWLNLYKDIKPGAIIYVNKAQFELQVTKIDDVKGRIHTKVIRGGDLKSGKGMNFPNTFLSNPPITNIDLEQVKFAYDNNWEYIACSFIRSKEDLITIKSEISKYLKVKLDHVEKRFKFIAKIEDQFGIDNINEIITQCFGIMIARGDMAAEIGYMNVPLAQEKLSEVCVKNNKYFITATEMLESMLEKDQPNKSDITDIYFALKIGTNAIMLSGEASVGKFPDECVDVMRVMCDKYSNNMFSSNLVRK